MCNKKYFRAAVYAILLMVVSVAAGETAIPEKISFQGQLLDSNGNPAAGVKSMVFSIYSSGSGFVNNAVATVQSAPATDIKDAYAYPNPYKPGSGGLYDADYITFGGLTSRASIEIYNIAGEKVAEIEKDSLIDKLVWEPKSSSGKDLASGVYIFYIEDPGGTKKTGKFSIIR
ncbi:MAG: T9SS type A sorting domain-containing protein [Elusimicrobiota bacterium]